MEDDYYFQVDNPLPEGNEALIIASTDTASLVYKYEGSAPDSGISVFPGGPISRGVSNPLASTINALRRRVHLTVDYFLVDASTGGRTIAAAASNHPDSPIGWSTMRPSPAAGINSIFALTYDLATNTWQDLENVDPPRPTNLLQDQQRTVGDSYTHDLNTNFSQADSFTATADPALPLLAVSSTGQLSTVSYTHLTLPTNREV